MSQKMLESSVEAKPHYLLRFIVLAGAMVGTIRAFLSYESMDEVGVLPYIALVLTVIYGITIVRSAWLYSDRKKEILRAKILSGMPESTVLSVENLVDCWQLDRNCVYKYEQGQSFLSGALVGYKVEKVLTPGIYLVKSVQCKRELQYIVKDEESDYISGDNMKDGFYRCIGCYVGEFADVRVLERVLLSSDLNSVKLCDLQ